MADNEVVRRTNDITAVLTALYMHATHYGDEAWLDRHEWFRAARAAGRWR